MTVNEAKELFIPSIKALTNKIIVNVEAKEEADFRKFLQAENWTNNVINQLNSTKFNAFLEFRIGLRSQKLRPHDLRTGGRC